MSTIDRQLAEDRLLRDAARELVKADVERVKADLDSGSIGHRALERVKDGAEELLDTATEAAQTKPGVLAALVGAIVLWFARNPILALLEGEESDRQDDKNTAPDPQSER